MSTDQPPQTEDPITEVPTGFKKRYVVITLLVVLAVVFGLRRARSKPVASDAAPPQTES